MPKRYIKTRGQKTEVFSGESLASIIDKFGCEIENLKIIFDDSYDSYGTPSIYVQDDEEYEIENLYYNKQLLAYEKAMEAYTKKLGVYEEKLNKYKEELAKFIENSDQELKQVEEEIEKRNQKLLKTLGK
jgi:predicted RNase H-like nuclease (RuvC/YqgF family)